VRAWFLETKRKLIEASPSRRSVFGTQDGAQHAGTTKGEAA
jgi:hypothetical protein